jgi:hypothetical protein
MIFGIDHGWDRARRSSAACCASSGMISRQARQEPVDAWSIATERDNPAAARPEPGEGCSPHPDRLGIEVLRPDAPQPFGRPGSERHLARQRAPTDQVDDLADDGVGPGLRRFRGDRGKDADRADVVQVAAFIRGVAPAAVVFDAIEADQPDVVSGDAAADQGIAVLGL